MQAPSRVRVAVVGLGYWGPNLARNFDDVEGSELAWCCDIDASACERWRVRFPRARFTTDLNDVLADERVDAVALATPVSTHGGLAEQVLATGKHCFVEKPLAQDVASAERLVSLAQQARVVLMTGHLLEYHPGVTQLRAIVDSGELGEVRYVYSQRLNLGKLRATENVLWSIGAHDISVLLAIIDEAPVDVWAHGAAFVRDGVEDVVFAFLRYASGKVAHLHLSWLDPNKERRITVVGSKRMATFDDVAMDRRLTVFDKGFDNGYHSYGEYITRSGASRRQAIANVEPLRIECEHFVECVRMGKRPRSDGKSGVRVVRILAALQCALETGQAVRLATSANGPTA